MERIGYGHLFPDQEDDAKAMVEIENRLLQVRQSAN
jgi:hypothetical protein